MGQPIHVQHVVLSLQPGGLENGVVNVVNGLSPEGFRSSVCCLKFGGEFVSRLKSGVAVEEMGWRKGNDLGLPFRLARLFRRTRPDVVHTRNAESFYYGFLGAKLAGIKHVVHSEHGRTFNDRQIRFLVQRWFSAYTSALFSVSEQLKNDLVAHVGLTADRIQVLHNGVDLDRFAGTGRDEARRLLGAAEGEVLVGSVGRLVPVKNYPLLLSAFATLDLPQLALILVGEGPERGALEAQARELGIAGRVRFLGHRDDVTALMPGLDVFVLPSFSEGMSNTLLEAMAASLPCVASAVGGNPEIVSHGKTGYLFPSGDSEALAGSLRTLCTDAVLRASLGAAGRQETEREYSLGAMIRRYEKLYRSLYDGKGGAT
ncbi:MAG: glycosyltransferase [Rhodocyclaceae bacterium]|nr:MAG: glycosyltransferase [Rhodocyclaceae bacterium]